VALVLFSIGFFGFVLARKTMLNEWKEASILKLERAAHYVDMRLSRPIQWMEMFNKTGSMDEGSTVQEWIVEQLRQLEGVTKVELKWNDRGAEPMGQMRMSPMMAGMRGMMHFQRARISEVTSPQYDTQAGQETVGLISIFKDESGEEVGALVVKILFAEGSKILAPIVRFRDYYFLGSGLGVLFILALIRNVVGQMIRNIKNLLMGLLRQLSCGLLDVDWKCKKRWRFSIWRTGRKDRLNCKWA
jgi:hypothetical protein